MEDHAVGMGKFMLGFFWLVIFALWPILILSCFVMCNELLSCTYLPALKLNVPSIKTMNELWFRDLHHFLWRWKVWAKTKNTSNFFVFLPSFDNWKKWLTKKESEASLLQDWGDNQWCHCWYTGLSQPLKHLGFNLCSPRLKHFQ